MSVVRFADGKFRDMPMMRMNTHPLGHEKAPILGSPLQPARARPSQIFARINAPQIELNKKPPGYLMRGALRRDNCDPKCSNRAN